MPSGEKTGKMTAPMLRSFDRLKYKMTLKELEYYFPVKAAQLSKIRSKEHWR